MTEPLVQPVSQTDLESQPSRAVPAARAFVAAVERMHLVLGALVLGASLVQTHGAALGSQWHWTAVLAGLVLGGGNFRVLAWLTTRMLLATEPATRNSAVVLLSLKLGLLAAAMLVTFRWVQPDGVTLALAMSLAPLCLIVEAVRRGGQLTDGKLA